MLIEFFLFRCAFNYGSCRGRVNDEPVKNPSRTRNCQQKVINNQGFVGYH
jgi:hypothetical protein